MKIGIQTWGSDGDILPFIALATGLRRSGHDVKVVYTSVDNKDYSHFSEIFDIDLIKAYGKFDEEKEKIFIDIINTRDSLKEFALLLKNFFDPAVEEMYTASKELCKESDLVIGHCIHYPLAVAAEKYNCPRVSVALCPMVIKSNYYSPFGPNLGKWLNSLLWKLGDRPVRKKFYQPADLLREKEGLPPFKNLQDDLYITKELTLVATCEPLCPRPPDWGKNIQICGFLNPPKMATDWKMPEGLRKFLKDGEPPVYFTFGSITQLDPEKTTRLFLDTANKSGVRAIIQSNWDNFHLPNDDSNIYKVQSIPHEHVFPHCSMIVHHGGSGTTQSSLRAGKPSLVVAHAFDQSFFGNKMHQLGVAGKTLQRRKITSNDLVKGIQAVLSSPYMLHNAQKASQVMERENGVDKAVALINQIFQ